MRSLLKVPNKKQRNCEACNSLSMNFLVHLSNGTPRYKCWMNYVCCFDFYITLLVDVLKDKSISVHPDTLNHVMY